MKLLTFDSPTNQTERAKHEREILLKQNTDLTNYAQLQRCRPKAAEFIGLLIQDALDDEEKGA